MKRLISKWIVLMLIFLPTSFGEVSVRSKAELPDDLTVSPSLLKGGEPLSLDEATRLALADNLDMKMARLERKIEQREKQIADATYDTEFVINATYSQDKQELASRIVDSRELEGVVETSFQKKIPLGTDILVKGGSKRNSSSNTVSTLDRSYSSFIGVSVDQPLLRNFFGYIDRNEIKQVKINIKKFDYATVDQIENSLAEVRNQYWDLVFAYGNLEARLEALERAQDFFRITKEKLEIGTAEEPDVFAAEANVRTQVLQALKAETNLKTQSYVLKVLLGGMEVHLIVPSDHPEFKIMDFDYNEELAKAFENRRDLKQTELALESQRIEVKIQSNERWPQLDLTGEWVSPSLDRELASSQGEVFSGNHPQYFAGVKMTTNLEMREERGTYHQAKWELARLEREFQKVRLQIGQEMDQSYRTLKLAQEQVKQTREIEVLQRKKLAEEEKDFNLGRSDSKTVIDYQDDVTEAKTETIRALVDYVKAVDGFYRTQHQLLEIVGVTAEAATEPSSKQGDEK